MNNNELLTKKKFNKKLDHFAEVEIEYVDYKDVLTLSKFIRQGRINGRKYTCLLLKNQKLVARAIKNARKVRLIS